MGFDCPRGYGLERRSFRVLPYFITWTISDEVEIRGRQFEGFDTFDWMRPGAIVADKQILLLFPLRMQERDGRDRRLGISGTASLGGCAGVRLCRVTRRHLRVFYWKSKGADCLGRSMETIRMRKMREVRWTWEGGRMCLTCPWTR